MRIGKTPVTALLLIAVGACGPFGPEQPALQMQEQAVEIQPQAVEAVEVQPKEVGPFTAYFALNSAVLDAKARSVISSAIATAKRIDPSEIIVAGHADRAGSAKYNLLLSKRRVHAVAKAFINAGYSPAIINKTIHGEDQPLISTSDGQFEGQNRRTVITLVRPIQRPAKPRMQAVEAKRKAEEERRLAAAEAKGKAEEEQRLAAAEAKRKAVTEERLAGVGARMEDKPCSQVQVFVSDSPVSVCIDPIGQVQR